MSPKPAENASMDIIRILAALTPGERVEALALAGMTYCPDCGYPTPPSGICHCRNDE
jgi:hypothetical protein